ncbi:MAG: multicopper oxidase domain-containing protein [Deltaproteobacteria bacterium]|nr:multicopper oxidase domain-containing protein [Deltaproteobacteria bacterium]
MSEKSTRRGFLAALGGLLASAGVAGAQTSGEHTGHAGAPAMPGMAPPQSPAPAPGGNMAPMAGMPPGGHLEHMGGMGPRFAWRDPARPLSPPPATMGRQMGRVHTLNVPPLGYERDGEVKVFRLVAQPVARMLTDGKPKASWEIIAENRRYMGGMKHHYPRRALLWGYNGQMPGPTLECTQGDRIRVILKNELPEPTSIHWHGLEVPNDMDGAGGTTEPVTPPGGTRVYEFTLHQVGTYMYHTGFNMMKQDGLGLGGFLVIHPAEPPAQKIDHDVAIMLQAFALAPGNDFPNLATMDFNWFTFNGTVAPDVEFITVNLNDRVRIRFGNLTMSSHPIHLHGHTWRVVGTEGGPIPPSAQWPGNTVNVAPGTTRDVEFVANNPGIWRMHCHKLHHTMNAHAQVPLGVMSVGGMFTLLHVKEPSGKGGHHA